MPRSFLFELVQSCASVLVAPHVEHQSAGMSKITNDVLTRSGTGCFIAVPTHEATVGDWASMPSKG